MKILNSMGLFTINEGGWWFTFTLQPWCWLRVFFFVPGWTKRHVWEWGKSEVRRI